MASLILTAMLALSETVSAQTNNQITWASVIFTYHGEKVPSLSDGPYNLTPLGANQLFDAGSIIRSRYVSAPDNGSEITTAAIINGISVNAIDNSQLYILSTDDEYISSSALAFMQGLYPPRNAVVIDLESILGNSSLEQYPLNGYQYPNVGTVSSLDFNYVWIAGNEGCTTYDISEVETLSSSAYGSEIEATADFYQSLAGNVFAGFDPSILNYGNAYDLYEYALYENNHNTTVYKTLSSADLTELYNLASAQQFDMNTPNSQGTIASIAGATLASKVLQQFSHAIGSSGAADKLTLLFGSFEPFLSFFDLSNLSVSPSASQFTSLPQHGSIMAFELFSYPSTDSSGNLNLSSPFPGVEELWVRFLFRNGTDDTAPFLSYPLFGRGNSETDMTWNDFVEGMATFSLNDLSDWCVSCESMTLFCEAIEEDQSNSSSTTTTPSDDRHLSPAIAGIIGATVTIGAFLILAIALALFGIRLDYHERRGKAPKVADIGVLRRSGSGNGGFKGAEKLASDTDLRLKGGAGATVIRHERVGSWELNESPTDKKHSSLDKEIESGNVSRVVSKADYGRNSEDGIGNVNPFGDPVKPLDQV